MAAIAYPEMRASSRRRGANSGRQASFGPQLRLVSEPERAEGRRVGPVPLGTVQVEQARERPRQATRGAAARWLPGLATVAVLVGTWFGAGALASAGSPRLERLPGSTPVKGGYSYVVRPGDTLWSIASKLEPGADPGALVARLAEEVHGATLQPGSVIVVP